MSVYESVEKKKPILGCLTKTDKKKIMKKGINAIQHKEKNTVKSLPMEQLHECLLAPHSQYTGLGPAWLVKGLHKDRLAVQTDLRSLLRTSGQ